jgi:formylglycine-generating enzyme required for sulfatase activity
VSRDSYTRYPRAILWLVAEGELAVDGETFHVEPFYLSKRPVTNLQYEAFAPDHRRSPASPGDDDAAVDVDFAGAHGYCEWYAGVSRKPMRLPTEIEWEHACRAGAGLVGMRGGVWEWTAEQVLRGGSSCTERREVQPDLRADDVGFRVARTFRLG